MGEVTDANDQAITTDGATDTVTSGVEFNPRKNCYLVKVLKSSTCDATTASLANASASIISSATFSGDIATFDGTDSLTSGTYYFILTHSGGSTYQRRYSNRTNPYHKTNITYRDGKDGGNLNDTHWWGIKSITTSTPDATNTSINIGDAWKVVAGAQINIGDSWKAVSAASLNVGDAWKTIF